MVRVAINGFGRIGRLAFRQMFGAKGYKIVAINDLTSPAMLAHLLKYDTAQKGYCGVIGENKNTVTSKEPVFEEDGKTVKVPGSITVDGTEITIYAEPKAQNLPWKKLRVDVVLECTGFYTSKAKAQAHIDAGAKKVVISAPAGNDLPTVVYNVNNNILTKEDKIISAASCTTNCLAPMTKALNDNFPIVSGIMTTVHAYTGDQMILDGPHKKGDLQRARRRGEHRSEQHRRGEGDRSRHSGTERQTDRLRTARPGCHRLHHDPRCGRQGQGCHQGSGQRRDEVAGERILRLHHREARFFRHHRHDLRLAV